MRIFVLLFCSVILTCCASSKPTLNDGKSWQRRLIDERLSDQELSEGDILFVTDFLTNMCACTDVENPKDALDCTQKIFTDMGFDLAALQNGEATAEEKRKLSLLSPMSPPTGTCPK